MMKEFSTVWGPPHTEGSGQTGPVAPHPTHTHTHTHTHTQLSTALNLLSAKGNCMSQLHEIACHRVVPYNKDTSALAVFCMGLSYYWLAEKLGCTKILQPHVAIALNYSVKNVWNNA